MDELTEQDIFELSPYDKSFPAKLLQEAFDFRVEESQMVTEKVYTYILKKADYQVSVPEKSEEKLRLAVDASDEFIQDYKDGIVKLSKEKGHMVAQVKEN